VVKKFEIWDVVIYGWPPNNAKQQQQHSFQDKRTLLTSH
jgi:hypothetical protein